jgi:hypothetical protein
LEHIERNPTGVEEKDLSERRILLDPAIPERLLNNIRHLHTLELSLDQYYLRKADVKLNDGNFRALKRRCMTIAIVSHLIPASQS